ncbi:MAG: ABC transporter permease [Firmicutes bacterium]|nr:ABC transporter permease [Bacillota bacterium]
MSKYILKRLLFGVVTLFALAAITFFLMHAIPGSPFAGETSHVPAEIRAKLIEHYGLDKSPTEQFVIYMKNALNGDFGTSLNRKGMLVADIIAMGLPVTAKLGACAFCLAMFMGILLGTIGAFAKHRWVKNAITFFATLGVSVPGFLFALFLMVVFGVLLDWFPLIGLSTWKHYIMPSVALSIGPIANITRLTKSSLSEQLKQDYMILARSKGTGQVLVIIRHALKNAMIPIITSAGPLLATLLTGSFVVESLFSIPGIGAEFVNSVSNRDFTLIMALTIMYGAMIIVANILTDIISAMIDPRIRLK